MPAGSSPAAPVITPGPSTLIHCLNVRRGFTDISGVSGGSGTGIGSTAMRDLLFERKDDAAIRRKGRGKRALGSERHAGVRGRVACVRSLTRAARPYEKRPGATNMQLSYPVQKRG